MSHYRSDINENAVRRSATPTAIAGANRAFGRRIAPRAQRRLPCGGDAP